MLVGTHSYRRTTCTKRSWVKLLFTSLAETSSLPTLALVSPPRFFLFYLFICLFYFIYSFIMIHLACGDIRSANACISLSLSPPPPSFAVCVCKRESMFAHTYIHGYTYVHIRIYICIHTHTHTHTQHTQRNSRAWWTARRARQTFWKSLKSPSQRHSMWAIHDHCTLCTQTLECSLHDHCTLCAVFNLCMLVPKSPSLSYSVCALYNPCTLTFEYVQCTVYSVQCTLSVQTILDAVRNMDR